MCDISSLSCVGLRVRSEFIHIFLHSLNQFTAEPILRLCMRFAVICRLQSLKRSGNQEDQERLRAFQRRLFRPQTTAGHSTLLHCHGSRSLLNVSANDQRVFLKFQQYSFPYSARLFLYSTFFIGMDHSLLNILRVISDGLRKFQ